MKGNVLLTSFPTTVGVAKNSHASKVFQELYTMKLVKNIKVD